MESTWTRIFQGFSVGELGYLFPAPAAPDVCARPGHCLVTLGTPASSGDALRDDLIPAHNYAVMGMLSFSRQKYVFQLRCLKICTIMVRNGSSPYLILGATEGGKRMSVVTRNELPKTPFRVSHVRGFLCAWFLSNCKLVIYQHFDVLPGERPVTALTPYT